MAARDNLNKIGAIDSITIRAVGNGAQGSGYTRSCDGYIDNVGFKSWKRGDINITANKKAYLYGIDSSGVSTQLADLKTTTEGVFEETAEYVKYRIYYYNGDDYGAADVSVTFYL